MSAPRPSSTPRLKKSETLEIRLPYPTKLAFMQSCRAEGRSASEALRQFIEGRIEAPPRPRHAGRRAWRLAAGALVAAAVGAVAAPSLALPLLSGAALRAEFDRLDSNGDHTVSLAEISRLDANHDGKVSFEEFRVAYPAGAR